MKTVKIAGACINQTPLDWEGNKSRLIAAIEAAKAEGVQLLCLPELAISGYGCEDTFFSEYVLQQSWKSLEEIAAVCEGIVVSVGLPLELENCLYNVSCLIQNKEILGFVAKQELAGDGVYYEPRWFKRWPDNLIAAYHHEGKSYPIGDLIFDISGIRIGFEICEDAWNGVRPVQDHYLNNVDIVLNPSASHFAFDKSEVRKLLVTETSRAYSCAYIYSNLLGNESGRLIYDGEILLAQGGKLLAQNERFSFADYQVLSTVIDVTAIRRNKKKSFNFEPAFPDFMVQGNAPFAKKELVIREDTSLPKHLDRHMEFYKAMTLALFDYMRKSRSRGFVISLSGGADSSACAVLTAAAIREARTELGEDGIGEKLNYLSSNAVNSLVQCVYQATDNSSEATLESARRLAEGLGATFMHWEVQLFFDRYKEMLEKSLGRSLNWEEDDIALQNVQARLRAPGVWMLANIRQALLVTTSNRSEAAVGYATMDGDTAGGLAPLGGVDKSFLLEWLKWAEEALNIPALHYVNRLKPTAELRPDTHGQTDEGDLMPYGILNQIEKAAIRDYKSPQEVFETLRGIAPEEQLKGYIRKFFRLWSRNQWKRERYAPSFHLDDANLDPKTWCRFPILNGGYEDLF